MHCVQSPMVCKITLRVPPMLGLGFRVESVLYGRAFMYTRNRILVYLVLQATEG